MRRLISIFLSMVCTASFSGHFFTVSATSSSITVRNLIGQNYPLAGIKITSSGYSIPGAGTSCTMNANGYCLFPITANGSKTVPISGSGNDVEVDVCPNAEGQLSCQHFSARITDYLYTVNFGNNTVSLCKNTSGSSLQDCKDAQASNLSFPSGIAFNPVLPMAYIANHASNSITYCTINMSTKLFSSCTAYTPGGLVGPDGIAVAEINGAYYVYVVANGRFDAAGEVCRLNNSGVPGSCINLDVSPLFSDVNGIAISENGQHAYLTQVVGDVYHCNINQTDGSFFGCGVEASTTQSQPQNVFINSAGTYAYIPTWSNNLVNRCAINALGAIGPCTETSSSPLLNRPTQVILNNSSTYAFVGNTSGNNLLVCPVDGSGNFGECTNSGVTGLQGPMGLAFLPGYLE